MKYLIDKWRKAEHKWCESATMFGACDEGTSAIRGIAFGEGSSAAYKDCADMLHDFIESKGQQLVNELVAYQHSRNSQDRETRVAAPNRDRSDMMKYIREKNPQIRGSEKTPTNNERDVICSEWEFDKQCEACVDWVCGKIPCVLHRKLSPIS